ncbi:MAG TPA: glycosyltransferase family 4 protein [Acidimicrobiales bacterium]|nr:glycosyltransferase family 4 protein [Acidimicrobiales bacterium]
MTRILVLSNFYPPHELGGYEMTCRDVMERLAGRGHEVLVLTSTYRRPDLPTAARATAPEPAPVMVRRSLRMYWDDHRIVRPGIAGRWRTERANQEVLRRALADFRPEVASVWNMAAMSLGLLTTLARAATPIVYAVCNDWLDFGRWMDGWSHTFAGRTRLGRAVEAVTGLPTGLGDLGATGTFCWVSHWTWRWAESHSPWSFPDSTVVYSGIDPSSFPIDPSPPPRPWRWRLLFVGRLEADKGADTAVRCLAHLPADATLEVVGPGSEEERRRVRRSADDAGVADRVSFDTVARSELAARYRRADVFVFPSRWEEPFGLVPVEAMACDTPVVATATGGAAEVLRDRVNCLTFGREDPEDLARAVIELSGNEALRRRLVAGGRRTAAALSVDALADCLEAWHVAAARRFADGRPPPRSAPDPAPG